MVVCNVVSDNTVTARGKFEINTIITAVCYVVSADAVIRRRVEGDATKVACYAVSGYYAVSCV